MCVKRQKLHLIRILTPSRKWKFKFAAMIGINRSLTVEIWSILCGRLKETARLSMNHTQSSGSS